MSHSLNSLKGDIWGIRKGTTIGVIKGDTRSLDYSSYGNPVFSIHSNLKLSESFITIRGLESPTRSPMVVALHNLLPKTAKPCTSYRRKPSGNARVKKRHGVQGSRMRPCKPS